jgi:RHH-type transcriptional regulator, rel operon repressor / antitoxin RelB
MMQTVHVRSAHRELNLLSIRLKPNIERRLNRLAKETGRTKTFYASKLIEENLEDLENRYLAEARLEKRGKSYTSAQARRELGLDD